MDETYTTMEMYLGMSEEKHNYETLLEYLLIIQKNHEKDKTIICVV